MDPDANLGLALGFKEEDLEKITPITEMKDLIKQRTHADEFERFFKINPKVDDLPDRLSYEINGVKLLLMGTVKVGGQGCVCPEHVILKRLLSHLIIQRDEVVIMDMEAGLEHLSRGTTDLVDQFIVVVEPGARSIQTYHSVQRLAKDLGVAKGLRLADRDGALKRRGLRRRQGLRLSLRHRAGNGGRDTTHQGKDRQSR